MKKTILPGIVLVALLLPAAVTAQFAPPADQRAHGYLTAGLRMLFNL